MTAVTEADPRVGLWKRVVLTLRAFGYSYPYAPDPRAALATVFVTRHDGGGSPPVVEARIEVEVQGGFAHAHIFVGEEQAVDLATNVVSADATIVAVVLQFVTGRQHRSQA